MTRSRLCAPLARSRTRSLLLAAMMIVAPRLASGQVAAGDTVRLWNADTKIAAGAFEGTDSLAVYLNPLDGGERMRVAFTEFSRAQVRHGTRRGGFAYVGKGALIGGGIALALGAVGYLGSGNHAKREDQFVSDAGSVVLGTVLGVITGTLIGSVAAVVPQENWQDVDLRRSAVR